MNQNPFRPEFGVTLDKPSFVVIAHMKQQQFVVSSYGMEKEGQKSSGLSLACLFPVAC